MEKSLDVQPVAACQLDRQRQFHRLGPSSHHRLVHRSHPARHVFDGRQARRREGVDVSLICRSGAPRMVRIWDTKGLASALSCSAAGAFPS